MSDYPSGRTLRILRDACNGEGRIYKSRYGGNHPDVWDVGPCPECDGTAYVDVESEPRTLEDMARASPDPGAEALAAIHCGRNFNG